jgi:hypothetical protein
MNNEMNNRNNYVNNILNDYYVYNPNTINKEQVVKDINNKLKDINKSQGNADGILSINEPIKVETDQYDTKQSLYNSMYDNRGKYFDLYDFNKDFDNYIRNQQKQRLLNEKLKLTDLSTINSIKIKPYQLPLDKLLINTKNTWFDLYDNIIKGDNPLDNFDEDKIFYVGITLIIFALLYIMLYLFFE